MNTFKDLQNIYDEILEEGRVSQHKFLNLGLLQAQEECRAIFIDLGFTTAATYAVMDYIYRLLPYKIKTPEVQQAKKKNYGAYLRPFVVNLVNQNERKINIRKLKSKMVDRELIKQYLERQDYGNRRQGLSKKLSKESDREIERDY